MTAAYCFAVMGRPRGPWRAERRDAEADAIAAGFASKDDWSGTAFLHPLASILRKAVEDGVE